MASNNQNKSLEEPTEQSLVQRMLQSVIRKSNGPKNLKFTRTWYQYTFEFTLKYWFNTKFHESPELERSTG